MSESPAEGGADFQRRASPWRVLAVAAQLALIAWVAEAFRLETPAFRQLLLIALGGFLLHALLAPRWRMPFFLLLSVAGFGLVLGWAEAAVLLGLGLSLIGLCHLPLPWAWRYGSLALAGGLLAWSRAGGIAFGVSAAVWPILASIFMFRLIVYLYDLRHARLEPSLAGTLAYFFLLPNVCFPLFPVIDYRTFRTSHYAAPAAAIYQRGMRTLFVGCCQLFAYRLVYHHLSPDPAEITSSGELLLYVVSAYLLILRVVGQFNVVVGLLRLFGFDLPPIFDRMFLASSFADLWRRANIYWRDFMLKIAFYPSYLPWSRTALGQRRPVVVLALATGLVFAATWALHSYQWFWLTGRPLLTFQDTLFWLAMGALVAVGVARQERRARRAASAPRLSPTARRLAHGARVVATFTSIALLISMWTADSLDQWLDLWIAMPGVGVALLGAIAALQSLASLVERLDAARANGPAAPRRVPLSATPDPRRSFWRSAALVSAAALVLIALGSPAVERRLGPKAAELVGTIGATRLNLRDIRAQERGYYEGLLAVSLRNSELRRRYQQIPEGWTSLARSTAYRRSGDLLGGELVPGRHQFKGVEMTVNRWGMRDRDYPRSKPAGSLRIALLDGSDTMGSGVEDDETFEAVFERWLNSTGSGRHFEVLNFAVGGYTVIENALAIEQKVRAFEPDVVLLALHTVELEHQLRSLARLLRKPSVPDPELEELLASTGVEGGGERALVERRLMPHRWRFLRWALGRIGSETSAQGAVGVAVLLPRVIGDNRESSAQILEAARGAGLLTFDLTSAFAGRDPEELQIAPWDDHPNALGHQLIATALGRALPASELEELVSRLPPRPR